MSHTELIIKYLTPPGRKLTELTSFRKFGYFHLSSRVPEIKSKGYPIKSRMVTDKKGKRYAEYFFE